MRRRWLLCDEMFGLKSKGATLPGRLWFLLVESERSEDSSDLQLMHRITLPSDVMGDSYNPEIKNH